MAAFTRRMICSRRPLNVRNQVASLTSTSNVPPRNLAGVDCRAILLADR